jgi:predicted HTH domain antitoxin
MTNLVIEISNELAQSLRIPPDEHTSRIRQELAVRLYQKGILSFGKARELAQMSKWEFHELLGREAIERSYDLEELEIDLNVLESLH